MTAPYTVRDPFHASEYVVIKRQARCCMCDTSIDDPTGILPWIDVKGVIMKGEKAVKCTIGNGPSTRTQHFHEECYFKARNDAMAEFLNPTWKVQRQHVKLAEVPYNDPADDIPFEYDYAANIPF